MLKILKIHFIRQLDWWFIRRFTICFSICFLESSMRLHMIHYLFQQWMTNKFVSIENDFNTGTNVIDEILKYL
jgi:hypothetical protein